MSVYSKRIREVFILILTVFFVHSPEILCAEKQKSVSAEKNVSLTEARKIDSSLIMSVKSLQTKIKTEKGITLVDVRTGDDFNKLRIPGSINVPLYAVKTKSFLKSGKAVLINEGYAYTELEKTCRQLRKSGFNIWILGGGLNAWMKSGLPVEGGGLYKRELNRVPPGDFFMEKSYSHWTVIDISSPVIKKNPEAIPGAVFLNNGNRDNFIKGFNRIVSAHKKEPLALALVYSKDGKGYGTVEAILKKSNFKNIFFLKGGIKEYNKYLEQRASMQGGRKTVKTEANCPTCPR